MNETIKPVVGYEGLYSVTSKGRVLSESRKRVKVPFKHPRGGHMYVNLSKDGHNTTRTIKSLMVAAWFGEPKSAVHTDGNPENNDINNFTLTW